MLLKKVLLIGLISILISLLFPTHLSGQKTEGARKVQIYKVVGAYELKAAIFLPATFNYGKPRAVIILLHGGGWNVGAADWMYDDAMHYQLLGMVAISGEYRLSDQKGVTPLEAMADVRDLVRWVREHASNLGVDPHRVAIYGVSAGAHLAASAAVFPHFSESKTSPVPDALLLLSPAVSLANDPWPQMLLGTRAQAKDISPAENIHSPLPPTVIFEGSADSVTPLPGVQGFCDQARKAGGACELHVYPELGHILTRNLDHKAQEEGPFDPDPKAMLAAHSEMDQFLERMGFLK